MRTRVSADYGRSVQVETAPVAGGIKLQAIPNEGSKLACVEVILDAAGALALAALLTVAAKEVKR